MNEIIPIRKQNFSGRLKNTVNARELHAFLQNKDHFSTWIKDRISQYYFIENQDFVIYSENSEKGRPRIEYFLSLDMAKELSMVERNMKGKQARQYFIECEKQLSGSLKPQIDFSDPIQAAQAFIQAETERRQLQEKLDVVAPKAKALDLISEKQGDLCLTDTAKMLQMRLKDLTAFLQSNKWIYKRLGSSWIAYQDKINGGYLCHVEHEYSEGRLATQVRVTAKGVAKLAEIFGAA